MARPRIHADAAARVAAHREKHDVVAVTFDCPRELLDGLNEYLKFKNLTKNCTRSSIFC